MLELGEVLDRAGDRGDRFVERGQVGPVGPSLQAADAGVVDRGGVHGDVRPVERVELLELALLGVQPKLGLVHETVEDDGPDGAALGDPTADLVVDVGAHVVRLREQCLGDPARLPGGAAPLSSRAQVRGARNASTSPSRITALPAVVVIALAAAKAAGASQATSGMPAQVMSSSVSSAWIAGASSTRSAGCSCAGVGRHASWPGSTGLATAHSTASWRIAVSAASAIARCSRTCSSRSRGRGAESGRVSAVSVIVRPVYSNICTNTRPSHDQLMLVGMILGHLRQNLVAYLALVVALSTGSAYAAAAIANGSVTTKKLANNAVTSNKLKNNSVKSIDIKSGTVNSDDIGTNAVSSLEIGDSSVTTVDIQDGTLLSADIKDDTIVRQDINDSVVPQDAEIFVGTPVPAPPRTVAPASDGQNAFPIDLPRQGQLAIEFFAGELERRLRWRAGPSRALHQWQLPAVDAHQRARTLSAGAVQIVAKQFLQAGTYTLATGEYCLTGTHVRSSGPDASPGQ